MTARPPVRITGLGSARPARSVSTEELLARTPPRPGARPITAQWVRERTGILARGLAGPEETVPVLAAEATAKALARAGVAPADVDLLLLATCSMQQALPGGAPIVAELIGAQRAGTVDLNAACSGFSYALGLGADAVRAGSARTVVVAAAERMYDLVDPADTGTAVLFGDGAGAVVVSPGRPGDPDGVAPPVWGNLGARADAIDMDPVTAKMRMQGPAVFRWATTTLAPLARQACQLAGVEPAELAAFVPHQANLRIVDSLVRALELPDTVRVARDIVTAGNTSAASIPLALDRLVAEAPLPSGAPVLIIGFGSGLSWAGQVIRLY